MGRRAPFGKHALVGEVAVARLSPGRLPSAAQLNPG